MSDRGDESEELNENEVDLVEAEEELYEDYDGDSDEDVEQNKHDTHEEFLDEGDGVDISHSMTNQLIISALSDLVNNPAEAEEDTIKDLATYKIKMKILLEQLMLKLEEDVEYQKNLEQQIDELERESGAKDLLIEQLTLSQKSSSEEDEEGKRSVDMELLNEELAVKASGERKQRIALERLVLRLQGDIAKLKVR
jgi:hypothetical protein